MAAPTGSGKTIVAEYAIARALADGGKGFYTTPLKALSNQKYGDLVTVHGAPTVGLLTGDNSVHGDARVVVMTTEVLRNMIYASSPALDALQVVVLDEVHYLQDRYRGPVWEEVIVHLAPSVRLVCLSATVSNAEEVAAWIQTVRGPTTAVIEEERPVRLEHRYLIAERGTERLHLLPTFVTEDGQPVPNPEAARLDGGRSTRGRAGRQGSGARDRGRGQLRTPGRVETVELLAAEGMLPAIDFVFSRAGCDQAVEQCLGAGLVLTDPAERAEIRAIVEQKTAALTDEDLQVLDYGRWLAGIEAGFAAHHAGMVPADEGSGRGSIRGRARQGRVRDRDARARHQHAGSIGRDREAVEVHRGASRVPDAGGVHAAHRSGRPARHRRPRVRGRVLEPVRPLRSGRVARVAPHRRAAVVVPARRTTWPPISCAATTAPKRTISSTCRSRSSTPTATSSRWSVSWAGTPRPSRAPVRPRTATSATSRTTGASRASSPPPAVTTATTARSKRPCGR